MRALTVEDLRALIGHDGAPCISIYMPTQRGGGKDDRPRYAGLVRRVREQLGATLKPAQVEELCKPLDELAKSERWSQPLDGLALFRAADVWADYWLPLRFDELCVVADSFHIRPLLRYLQSDERFLLLNLSQNRVSLFKGSALGLGPIELAGMPRSLAESNGPETREHELHFHPGHAGHGKAPIFHGDGSDESVREEELLQFLRRIDRALWEVLRDETAPLVVAATGRIAAAFQATSRYPHLLHDHVAGSFANARLEDLHARAWPLVQAWSQTRSKAATERYGNLISKGRAVDEVSAIARHAVEGRIRDLFVDRDAHLWGRMDRQTGAIELHERAPKDGEDDVLDDISEAVLLRGGEVHSLAKGSMPARSPVAATLRW